MFRNKRNPDWESLWITTDDFSYLYSLRQYNIIKIVFLNDRACSENFEQWEEHLKRLSYVSFCANTCANTFFSLSYGMHDNLKEIFLACCTADGLKRPWKINNTVWKVTLTEWTHRACTCQSVYVRICNARTLLHYASSFEGLTCNRIAWHEYGAFCAVASSGNTVRKRDRRKTFRRVGKIRINFILGPEVIRNTKFQYTVLCPLKQHNRMTELIALYSFELSRRCWMFEYTNKLTEIKVQ